MVRVKYRYILAAVHFKTKGFKEYIGPEDVSCALRASLSIEYGQAGLRSIAPSVDVLNINSTAGTCLLRVARRHSGKLLECLPSVISIRHRSAQLQLLKVSGSRAKIEKLASEQKEKLPDTRADAHPAKVTSQQPRQRLQGMHVSRAKRKTPDM
jgi:RNase P/RNase MRP subunit POP5